MTYNVSPLRPDFDINARKKIAFLPNFSLKIKTWPAIAQMFEKLKTSPKSRRVSSAYVRLPVVCALILIITDQRLKALLVSRTSHRSQISAVINLDTACFFLSYAPDVVFVHCWLAPEPNIWVSCIIVEASQVRKKGAIYSDGALFAGLVIFVCNIFIWYFAMWFLGFRIRFCFSLSF